MPITTKAADVDIFVIVNQADYDSLGRPVNANGPINAVVLCINVELLIPQSTPKTTNFLDKGASTTNSQLIAS